MRPQDLARLVALAAMWGASYLFMRYAVPHMGPVLLIELRVLIAGAATFIGNVRFRKLLARPCRQWRTITAIWRWS